MTACAKLIARHVMCSPYFELRVVRLQTAHEHTLLYCTLCSPSGRGQAGRSTQQPSAWRRKTVHFSQTQFPVWSEGSMSIIIILIMHIHFLSLQEEFLLSFQPDLHATRITLISSLNHQPQQLYSHIINNNSSSFSLRISSFLCYLGCDKWRPVDSARWCSLKGLFSKRAWTMIIWQKSAQRLIQQIIMKFESVREKERETWTSRKGANYGVQTRKRTGRPLLASPWRCLRRTGCRQTRCPRGPCPLHSHRLWQSRCGRRRTAASGWRRRFILMGVVVHKQNTVCDRHTLW